MAEGGADQVKPETQNLTRVERIKAGIGKWIGDQLLPPNVEASYRRTFTVIAEKLAGKQPELLAKLQGPIETVAKALGYIDPVVKVAVGAAALYGGVTLLLRPDLAYALGSSAVILGKNVVTAGTAAAVGAYRFVETGVKELGAKVKLIAERIWQGVTGAEIPSQTHPPGGLSGLVPEAPPVPVPPRPFAPPPNVPIVKPVEVRA